MLKKVLLSGVILCGIFSNNVVAYQVLGDIAGRVGTEIVHTGSIIGGATFGAMAYGIINDQVTARICLPYFTRGFHQDNLEHWEGGPILGRLKPILEKHENSPTIVASIWGPIATVGVGLPLGVLSALCARFPLGKLPQLRFKDLRYPLLGAMAFTGLGALYGGVKTYFAVKNIENPEDLRREKFNDRVPTEELKSFQVCSGAHHAAYKYGPIAGLGVCGWIVAKRVGLI